MARVTDYTLERYALGELSPEAAAEVDRALGSDPELQVRLDGLRADSERFLAEIPPRVFVAELEWRAKRARRQTYGFAILGALSLAAAAILAVNLSTPEIPVDGGDPSAEEIRIKGPLLRVYRQSGDDAEALRDGDVVIPGSAVQLALARGATHAAVFSVDGRGTVTRHLPRGGSRSVAVEPGPLPDAFALDTVPDFERFFLVTGEQPFELAPVESALGALDGDPKAAPKLPADLDVHSLLLRKVNP